MFIIYVTDILSYCRFWRFIHEFKRVCRLGSLQGQPFWYPHNSKSPQLIWRWRFHLRLSHLYEATSVTCLFRVHSHAIQNEILCCKYMTWRRHQMETFFVLLAYSTGNSAMNSPHKGQWRGALMFSLICAWTNNWVNNGDAGDLRRYRAHYDVVVMRNVKTARWRFLKI